MRQNINMRHITFFGIINIIIILCCQRAFIDISINWSPTRQVELEVQLIRSWLMNDYVVKLSL